MGEIIQIVMSSASTVLKLEAGPDYWQSMASSLFEQQSEGGTSDLSLSAGGVSAKVHGALLHQLTPELASLINAIPSCQGCW